MLLHNSVVLNCHVTVSGFQSAIAGYLSRVTRCSLYISFTVLAEYREQKRGGVKYLIDKITLGPIFNAPNILHWSARDSQPFLRLHFTALLLE